MGRGNHLLVWGTSPIPPVGKTQYVYIYIYIYIHNRYIYIHTHTHIYIYIYTYIHNRDIAYNIFPISSNFLNNFYSSLRNCNTIFWETRTILKIFWDAVDLIVNTVDFYGTLRSLIMPRNKTLVGSIDEAVKTFQI